MKTLGLPLLLLLIAISAIGPLTLNGVLPATSAIMAELDAPYKLAQLVLTVFLFASLLSQLIMGPAADHFGRRPIMVFSLAIFILGSLLCATATSIEWLLLGRFVQGIGGAVCVILPRTIVRDLFSRDRAASVIGYMTTAMMVAPLFGPAVGGWVTDLYSWRYLYAGLAAIACLLVLFALRYQRETLASKLVNALPETEKESMLSSTMVLLRDTRFLACAAMQTGAVGVYYAFLAGAPYVAMESRGLSASSYGMWFAMVAIGYLSGNLIAGRFSDRLGVDRMILLGFVPFIIGIVLLWLLLPLSHPISLFLPMQLLALSNGMSLPSMFSVAMSIRPTLAATASGLAGSAQTAFGVVLTFVVGYVLPYGDAWLFALMTLSAVLSLWGLFISRRQLRTSELSNSA